MFSHVPVKILVMVPGHALRLRCAEEFAALGLDALFCPPGQHALQDCIALNRPAACLVNWALLEKGYTAPAAPVFFALTNSDTLREAALCAGCEKAYLLPADWRYIGITLRRRLGLSAFPPDEAAEKVDALLRSEGISAAGAGGEYLRCALSLLMNEPALARSLHKGLYPQICLRCGAPTPAAVSKGIERVLRPAGKARGEVPFTPVVFFQYAVERLVLGGGPGNPEKR